MLSRPPALSPDHSLRSRRQQRLLFAARWGIGFAILGVAFSFVDARGVVRSLAAMDVRYFAMALLLTVLSSILIPAVITGRTLRVAGIQMSLAELIRINLSMRFYVLILPLPVTVGMRWLRYRGPTRGKGWDVAALLLFERVVQGTVVLAAAFGFLLAARRSLPPELVFLVPLCGLLSLAALGLLLLFLSRRAFTLVQPLALSARLPQLISARLERLAAAVAAYQTLRHRHIAAVLCWSITADALAVGSAFVVSRGLGMDVGLADLGWMRSIVFLLTVLPITVGGLGIREAGYATFFHLRGIEGSVALAFPLVLLTIQLLIGLSGSLVEALRVVSSGGSDAGATEG